MSGKVQFFLDGGFLRQLAKNCNYALIDPHMLAYITMVKIASVTESDVVRNSYYDAIDDSKNDLGLITDSSKALYRDYLSTIERSHNTHLSFGSLRGSKKKGLRQKGVDVLLAVQMLAAAYNRTYEKAFLVTGDADFVPVVEEVHRTGANVYIVTWLKESVPISEDLISASDGLIETASNTYPWPHLRTQDDLLWIYRGDELVKVTLKESYDIQRENDPKLKR